MTTPAASVVVADEGWRSHTGPTAPAAGPARPDPVCFGTHSHTCSSGARPRGRSPSRARARKPKEEPPPSAPQLARQIAPFLHAAISIIPQDLAGICGSSITCEAEIRDAYTLLCGRDSELGGLCLLGADPHLNLDKFSVLAHFANRISGSGDTRLLLERLQCPPGESPCPRQLGL